MNPQIKQLHIIKSNGASSRVVTSSLITTHKQYVPFRIKSAWREKVKKTGVTYDNFIGLSHTESSS